MEPSLAVITMLAVSAQFALQAPLNARLAITTGRIVAALVNFLVGTTILLVAVLASGNLGGFGEIGEAAPYELTGGMIGAAFVLTTLATVPIIGAGGVAAAAFTGQMIGSIALDGTGALGLETEPVTAARLAGAALLMSGTMLIIGGGHQREDRPPGNQDRGLKGALAAVAIILGGLLLAAHAPINAGLGDEIGDLDASLVNFVVGSLVLAVAVLIGHKGGGLLRAFRAPRRYLLGGLIGAVYVTAAVALVQTIGAGGVAAATITGQLAASMALDRAGALGLSRRPLTVLRLAGLALLGAGTYLVVG